MSTALLPTLPGVAFPVSRTPVFSTLVQTAISGKEARLATQSAPRWKWELSYNILRSAAAYAEYQELLGFFNSRQGMFDSFLYQDADDNAVTGQGLGTGNGVATDFQLVRAFGGFIEPVLAPNVVSAVYLNGVSIPSSGLNPPSACSLSSVAGGSLAATTYYVRPVWVTASGVTLAGTESSLAVAANRRLVVSPPSSPPAAATNWAPFVSNTTMGGSGAEQNQGTGFFGGLIPSASWTEPTTGLVSDGAMPSSNTTGWSVTPWGTTSPGPGMVVFGGAVANGYAVSADFSYYWPCRMSADDLATSLFMSSFYEVKKFTFISVKN